MGNQIKHYVAPYYEDWAQHFFNLRENHSDAEYQAVRLGVDRNRCRSISGLQARSQTHYDLQGPNVPFGIVSADDGLGVSTCSQAQDILHVAQKIKLTDANQSTEVCKAQRLTQQLDTRRGTLKPKNGLG